tara:strand:+ start:14278 stop:14586 length:309 start_codon:yes stop_codon:yes gene_type:complete
MPKKDKKLEDIRKKIDDYKLNHAHQKETNQIKRGRQISIALRLSTELIIATIVGGVLGWYIDKWLETKPIFFLIFLILGIISGVMTAIKTAQQLYENDIKND